MKGLFIKDCRTILNNNRTFLAMMIGIILFLSFTVDSLDFVGGYLTIVGSMLALGTISYDQAENGMPFLLTLPISRKMYVQSKYLFSVLFSVALIVLVNIISVPVSIMRGYSYDISMPAGMFAGCLIFLFIMIPLQLKFGVEKARIALVIVFGVIVCAITGAVYIGAGNGIYVEDVTASISKTATAPAAVYIILAVLIMALLGFISYCFSVKTMENKEY